MNRHFEYLKGYVENMKSQAKLFHTLNADLMERFKGRRVNVIDKMGNRIYGIFKGFNISLDPNKLNAMPGIFICIQLLKKDGTPSGRERMVNCEDALIRVMGMTRPC